MRNGNTTQMSRLCPPLNNPFWKAYERHTNYSPPAGWNSLLQWYTLHQQQTLFVTSCACTFFIRFYQNSIHIVYTFSIDKCFI